MFPSRSRTPAPASPRAVGKVLVGWLDSDGVVRPGTKHKLMSESEALALLSDDIERFGEPEESGSEPTPE
jgi:hypothetical protein